MNMIRKLLPAFVWIWTLVFFCLAWPVICRMYPHGNDWRVPWWWINYVLGVMGPSLVFQWFLVLAPHYRLWRLRRWKRASHVKQLPAIVRAGRRR